MKTGNVVFRHWLAAILVILGLSGWERGLADPPTPTNNIYFSPDNLDFGTVLTSQTNIADKSTNLVWESSSEFLEPSAPNPFYDGPYTIGYPTWCKTSGHDSCPLTVSLSPSRTTDACQNSWWFVIIRSSDNTASHSLTMSSFMVIDWAPDKTALNFGQVALGQQSPAQTITLTNHGLQGSASLPLYIASPSGDFSRVSSGQNDCGTTLSPQQSCTIAIVLTPTASGPRSGSFTIDGGDCAGDPRTISLSGNSTSSGQPDFVVISISLSLISPIIGGTFNATIMV